MSKLKVFIEGGLGSGQYITMFLNNGWEETSELEEADLVQFVGGADVSPHYYGEDQHPSAYCSEQCDKYTLDLYERAAYLNIPMAGICRGSQFLCVMGGGKLWQDVDGHAIGRNHSLIDKATGIVIDDCSSTHHQQHRPSDNAIIIATSSPQLCGYKEGMKDGKILHVDVETGKMNCSDMSIADDIEAFYYKHINALGFQPHPEFFNPEHPCQKYYFDLIAKYLNLWSN